MDTAQSVIIINLISWLSFGVVVGLLVQVFDPDRTYGGAYSSVLAGILGAVCAGYAAVNLLHISPTKIHLQSLGIIAFGALVVVLIEHFLLRKHSSDTSGQMIG